MNQNMDRTNLAKKYKQEGMTYAEIGELLNISRQRVHQLIAGNPTKIKKSVDHSFCEKCGLKTTRLEEHHLDYLSGSTTFLCQKCHKTAHRLARYAMANRIIYVQRNINLRQEVFDLIEGEAVLRRNGEKGFSLTLNQIILEYFDMRTPKNIAVSSMDGEPALTVEEPA